MTTQASPVTVVARFDAREGHRDDVRDLLGWMVEHTRQEPGCARYDLYAQRDDARTFVLVESYKDPDALEAHRAASSTIASVISRIRSSASTVTDSVGSWLRSVPFATFRTGRPAETRALASLPPPVLM